MEVSDSKWLQEQVEAMAITHLQGKTAKCPHDGGVVKVVNVTRPGQSKALLNIHCPICGNDGRTTAS